MITCFTKILVHLSLIDTIGPVTIAKLLKITNNFTGIDIYAMPASFFVGQGIIQSKSDAILKGLADRALLNEELDLIDKHNVTIVSILDAGYPSLLKEITLPPTLIYAQGDSSLLHSSSISIVGSRKADVYGKRVVEALVPPLVNVGLTIVSGGATGIDTFVHTCALKHGGKTISVLGSGLLNLYPKGNTGLFEAIKDKAGLLISCFPMNSQPLSHNFVERNRVITGLSKGCVVVQAQVKSGALISARYALEQGREVFAVPGPLDVSLSEGCHTLIAQGAIIVQNAQTILDNISHVSTLVDHIDNQENYEEHIQQEGSNPILNACSSARSFDELLALWQGSEQQLHAHLFDLECDQKIEQQMSGLWIKI